MIKMFTELFAQAEADYRIQRFLREADKYRLARSVPTPTSRIERGRGRIRAFVVNVVTAGL
jgi:hypothetical protein